MLNSVAIIAALVIGASLAFIVYVVASPPLWVSFAVVVVLSSGVGFLVGRETAK